MKTDSEKSPPPFIDFQQHRKVEHMLSCRRRVESEDSPQAIQTELAKCCSKKLSQNNQTCW